ncbi:uncharacterized protein LY89DRAFT_683726, partial [Mollisia scopiformis]
MSLVENLSALLADRQKDRLTIPFEILSLYLATELCSKLFSRFINRFDTRPALHQRQLSIIPPIIGFKLVIIALFLSRQPSITSSSLDASSIDELFNIINHTAIGYLFEILYRPSPPLLQGHHILLQSLTYYFILYLRFQSSYMLISQFTSIFIIFGMGLTDSFVDLMVLVYRLAPEGSEWSSFLVKLFGRGSEVARAAEWVMLCGFIVVKFQDLSANLSDFEMIGWALALALWVWTEVDDFITIRAMTSKFGIHVKH